MLSITTKSPYALRAVDNVGGYNWGMTVVITCVS